MSLRTPKCIEGKRHDWVFIKNFIRKRRRGQSINFTRKGKFQCSKCKIFKAGDPMPEQSVKANSV